MVVLTEKDREDYISHGVSAETISCISNPLTIEAAPAAVIRDKKVVSIGRFSPEKGFDLLLQAWAIVEKEDTEWKLEIWGDDGRYEHSLHQQLQDLDLKRATLHGTTKDVATLFNKSSIYVLSSRNESFGLVLLEASVCGLPLVAFDCPNGPGVIIGEGVNGTLVKPGDVPSLASALLDLMKNDKRRFEMGQNALKMSKRFTAERIVDQWEELFKRL